MSVWDWVFTFYHDARQKPDREDRHRLYHLFSAALEVYDTDAEEAVALLNQARSLAQQLNEPWWEQLCNHWQLQVLLFRRRDYQAALDMAVRSTVEVRKSLYEHFPQRVCLHEDLINSYVGIDITRYSTMVTQAMDYMEQQISPEMECRFCLQGLRTRVALEQGQLDEALDYELGSLAMAESEDHYLSSALTTLAAIAYQRRDWEQLRAWSGEGETVARRADKKSNLVELVAWRAVAARQAGEDEAAARLYRSATTRAARLRTKPGRAYYDALAAYHELTGDWERAFKIRERQLTTLIGGGQLLAEARCRLERCRLLALMGKSTPGELEATREIANRLAKPEIILAQLDQLAAGTEPAT